MKGVQIGMHIVNKRVIDLHRDIVGVQGTVQAGLILAHACKEHVFFDLGIELCAKGLLESLERLPKGIEHSFAISTIR